MSIHKARENALAAADALYHGIAWNLKSEWLAEHDPECEVMPDFHRLAGRLIAGEILDHDERGLDLILVNTRVEEFDHFLHMMTRRQPI